jgi:hypothetical protein
MLIDPARRHGEYERCDPERDRRSARAHALLEYRG